MSGIKQSAYKLRFFHCWKFMNKWLVKPFSSHKYIQMTSAEPLTYNLRRSFYWRQPDLFSLASQQILNSLILRSWQRSKLNSNFKQSVHVEWIEGVSFNVGSVKPIHLTPTVDIKAMFFTGYRSQRCLGFRVPRTKLKETMAISMDSV